MSSWVDNALSEAVPYIKERIRAVRSDGHGYLVAFMDVVNKLQSLALAQKVTVPNRGVLVHPSNRFGSGLDINDLHSLIEIVINGGWIWEKVGMCVGFELPDDDDSILTFNETLVSASGGWLAPVSKQFSEIASVAGSHTVSVLRSVEHSVRHGEPDEDSDIMTGGVLSREKVLRKCPSLQQPLDAGLQWVKIKKEVALAIPELADFLSEAANSNQNSSQEHTKTQVLLQIHQKAMQNRAVFGDEKWDLIVRTVENNCPSLKNQGKAMAAFVAAYAGGDKPTYLHQLDGFGKSLPRRADISTTSLGRLAASELAQAPEYIVSCVMALLASPPDYCEKGVSTLLSPGDILSITDKKKSSAIECAKLIRTALTFCTTMGLEQSLVDRMVGELRVQLVMFTHSKKSKYRKVFESKSQICEAFMHDLCEAVPALKKSTSLPWTPKPFAEAASTEAVPKAKVGPLRTFVDGKIDLTTLKQQGFVVGACVTKKDVDFKIKSVAEAEIELEEWDDGHITITVSPAQLVDEFKVTKKKAPLAIMVQSFAAPQQHPDVAKENIQAMARIAMLEGFDQYYSSVDVEVKLKPKRGVFANKEYAKDELKLVALSPSVNSTKVLSQVPKAAAVFKVPGDYIIYVNSKTEEPPAEEPSASSSAKTSNPFVVPFWCVRRSPEQSVPNMALSHIKVKINMRGDGFDEKPAFEVDVPCLVNTRKLAVGQELVIAEPSSQKAREETPKPKAKEETPKSKGKGKKRKAESQEKK